MKQRQNLKYRTFPGIWGNYPRRQSTPRLKTPAGADLCAILKFLYLVFKYYLTGSVTKPPAGVIQIINIHYFSLSARTQFVPTNSLPCSFLVMRRHFFLPPLDEQQLPEDSFGEISSRNEDM